MDIQGCLECIQGSSQKNNLELAKLKMQQENVTDTTFDGGNVNYVISESVLTPSPLCKSQKYVEEEARVEKTSEKTQVVDYTLEREQDIKEITDIFYKSEMKDKATPTSHGGVIDCPADTTFKVKLQPEDIQLESTTYCDNWKEDIVENAGMFKTDERKINLKDGKVPEATSSEQSDGNFKDKISPNNADKSRKHRLAAAQEMNRRKLRRKAPKDRSSPQTPPRIGTRRNPCIEHNSSPEHLSDVCPIKRWPRTSRMERPEYPRCMENEEEEEAFESEGWSEESSESDSDTDGGSFPHEAFEASIVPGTLESVVVYCRTSPLLPPPMRPDPEALRDLLHDSCVLQCILRGVAPATIAAYLDSETARSAATDFAELSDFAAD